MNINNTMLTLNNHKLAATLRLNEAPKSAHNLRVCGWSRCIVAVLLDNAIRARLIFDFLWKRADGVAEKKRGPAK